MVFRSTEPEVLDTQRRPFTSTRVRSEPRLRRLMVDEPSPPLLKLVFRPAPLAEMRWSTSATEVRPCFSIAARSMMKTGWEFSTSTERMREPVTSMRSRLVGDADSWATAVVAVPAVATSAITTASRSLLCLKFIALSLSKWAWVRHEVGFCGAETKGVSKSRS